MSTAYHKGNSHLIRTRLGCCTYYCKTERNLKTLKASIPTQPALNNKAVEETIWNSKGYCR